MSDRARANVSIINDPPNDDYDNLLKLKHKLEKKERRIITLVEVVRIAVKEAIANNK